MEIEWCPIHIFRIFLMQYNFGVIDNLYSERICIHIVLIVVNDYNSKYIPIDTDIDRNLCT